MSSSSSVTRESVTPSDCFDILGRAHTKVVENSAVSSKNQHNISVLARENLALKTRLSTIERADNLGTLKIEGRGLPPYNRRENLCQLVRDIAYHDFGIKIHPNEIDRVRRASLALKSPILVKFGNTHVSSVLYRLLDPKLKGKMARARVFWTRYQVAQDHHIHRISAELRKAGLLYSFFVDRQHVTVIQRTSDCQPRAIKCVSDFTSVFTNNHSLANHIISRHDETHMLSLGVDNNAPVVPVVPAPVGIENPVAAPAMEAPEVAASAPQPADVEMDVAPLVSTRGANIIDAIEAE